MLDYLIKDTFIIDGTGSQGFIGSVGIKAGKIALVARGAVKAEAARVIDGAGLVTCPGFIDVHGHQDLSLPEQPAAESHLLQGITSYVGGHCGLAMAPGDNEEFMRAFNGGGYYREGLQYATFDEWLDKCAPDGTGPNYVPLAGDGMIRGCVLGLDYTRVSTHEEKERIKVRLSEALDAGVFGFSVSYDVAVPGHWADDDELVGLLELVRDRGALYAPHTRHHQYNWFADNDRECSYGMFVDSPGEIFTGRMHGLIEPVEFTERVQGLRTMISHMTPIYNIPQPHPAYVDEAMARAAVEDIIEKPRARGLDVTFNVIPCEYSVGQTLRIRDMFFHPRQSSLWPDFYRKDSFIEDISSRDFRDKATKHINSGRFKFYMVCPGVDPYWSESFMITKCAQREYIGKTVYELALQRAPQKRTQAVYREAPEVLYDILAADPDAVCAFVKDKREYNMVPELMRHPCAMPCTDSHGSPYNFTAAGGADHPGVSPSTYNMFPAYLLKTVKEAGVMDLPEAVRKATSLPASVVGIEGRGTLKEGLFADITVMDWDNLAVRHDFLHPNDTVDGVRYVFVNGRLACEDKRLVNTSAGCVLRKGR